MNGWGISMMSAGDSASHGKSPMLPVVTGEHGSPQESLAGGCLLTVSPRVKARALLRPPGERDGRAECPRGEASTANRVGRQESR